MIFNEGKQQQSKIVTQEQLENENLYDLPATENSEENSNIYEAGESTQGK